jgi:hypothetical protein
MSSDAQNNLDSLVAEFDAFKERIKEIYEQLGLGKDELLRAHGALDVASAAVAAHGGRDGHDLNDDLAASPEDHPAAQGHVPTPINMDDPAADPEVPNQNPERRTGSADTPEPALAAGDPVRLKDEAETPVENPGMSVQAHDGDAV